jgi:hypothetical protein
MRVYTFQKSLSTLVLTTRAGDHENRRANLRSSPNPKHQLVGPLQYCWVVHLGFVLVEKREPGTAMQSVLCWGTLAAIHVSAIKAVRRRYGWFYLVPIGFFWILVLIALSGGITY